MERVIDSNRFSFSIGLQSLIAVKVAESASANERNK
jgi:hypothetical protein